MAATARVLAQLLDHLGAAGLVLRRPQQGDVHADIPALQAQAGHVVGGEAVQGAHQHRQQGDVLVRVVDHPQQGEHDAYLRRLEKAPRHAGPGRHPAGLELLGVGVGVLVGAAQQHAEVPVGGGPLPLLVRNGEAALHQLADAPGNPGALGLLGGGPPLAGDELQLGLAALLGGVVRPAHQALLPGVVHVLSLIHI